MSFLDLPFEVFTGTPYIEIRGDEEVVISGCKNILEFQDDILRINCGKLTLRVAGNGLTLTNMSENRLVVAGKICEVSYI